MKKFISIIAAAVLSAGIVFTPFTAQAAVYPNALTAAKASSSSVSAPKADKKSDLYLCDGEYLKVNLSCSTKNADIYYKINNGKYKKYTKTIGITKNSTLSAYAKLGDKKSKTVAYEYKLGVNFSISNYGGDFDENQMVKITTKVPDVTFRYTLNGERVTEKSKKFPEKGLKIENTAEFSVSAYKDGWSEVGHYGLEYNINKLDNYKLYHHYNQLSDKEKIYYERILNALKDGSSKADTIDLYYGKDGTSLEKVIGAFRCDINNMSHLSWFAPYNWELGSDNRYYMVFNYNINDPDIQKKQKKLEEKAAEVIEKAKEQPTAYGKIKYIHDWLVNNTEYVSSGKNHTAAFVDGPIVYGIGACDGYSRAFYYLASSLGFDCIRVGGTIKIDGVDTLHAWNKVKINGIWYNVDVTWDDFSQYGDDKIYYEYFLRSDANFKNHTPFDTYTYPASPKDYPVK